MIDEIIEELQIPSNLLEDESQVGLVKIQINKTKTSVLLILSAVNDLTHESIAAQIDQKAVATTLSDLYNILLDIRRMLNDPEYNNIAIQAMGICYNSRLPFLLNELNDKPHLWV